MLITIILFAATFIIGIAALFFTLNERHEEIGAALMEIAVLLFLAAVVSIIASVLIP